MANEPLRTSAPRESDRASLATEDLDEIRTSSDDITCTLNESADNRPLDQGQRGAENGGDGQREKTFDVEAQVYTTKSESTEGVQALSASPYPHGSASKLKSTWVQLSVHVLTLSLLAIVVIFVQGTYAAQKRSDDRSPLDGFLKIGVSTTLAVLRAAQGILSALTSMSLYDAFVFIQWAMMNDSNGLVYPSLLALSPTTSIYGLVSLVHSSSSNASARFWALLRTGLMAVAWISGLVLFFNTAIVTVYDTAMTYRVTAGVGSFNGSLVEPFFKTLHSNEPDYPYQILPYTYFAAVYFLVLNPLISTVSEAVSCPNGGCVSYLLSGGLEMAAPWNPEGYADYPLVKIADVTSLQLDFDSSTDKFQSSDCDVFGETGFSIGIRLCVTHDPSSSELVRAGLFVCLNGTSNGQCQESEPAPNITTTMSAYTRQANVVAVRSNYSIIDIEATSPAVKVEQFDIDAYRTALRWLLNYTAANIPAPSSVAQSFWSSPQQLMDNSTYGILSPNFQSILAFPFWIFNNNNWGNIDLLPNQIISTLPPQFYTQASIVAPYSKIRFDRAMFILFLVFQGLATIFTLGVLAWVWLAPRVFLYTSSYPLFDFAYKAQVRGRGEQHYESLTKNSKIISLIKDVSIHAKIN